MVHTPCPSTSSHPPSTLHSGLPWLGLLPTSSLSPFSLLRFIPAPLPHPFCGTRSLAPIHFLVLPGLLSPFMQFLPSPQLTFQWSSAPTSSSLALGLQLPSTESKMSLSPVQLIGVFFIFFPYPKLAPGLCSHRNVHPSHSLSSLRMAPLVLVTFLRCHAHEP